MRDEQLIHALRELGAVIDDTATQQHLAEDVDAFVASVVGRVEQRPAPGPARRRRSIRRVLAVLSASLLLVLPGPRHALARWLGIGSVRVNNGNVASGVPGRIRALDLGTPITADAATSLLHHRPWTPRGAALLGMWSQPEGPMINSVYRIDGHDVLVSELPGPGEIYVVKKVVPAGSSIDFFDARGATAAWISGDPHEVAMLSPSGLHVVAVRLAGDVLLWADPSRTIRIEGLDDRDAAVAILKSLR